MGNLSREYRSFLFIHCLSATLAFGGLNVGWNLGNFNAMSDFMAAMFSWNHQKKIFYESSISALICFGAIFGVLITWVLSKVLPRMMNVYLMDMINIIGSCLTLVKSETFILLGRFTIGVSMGMNSIMLPILLRELSTVDIRGRLCGFNEIFIGIGTFISFLFELGLPIRNKAKYGNLGYDLNNQWWRVMFAIPIFFSLFRTIMIFFVFKTESPLYLYTRGREEAARESLSKLVLEEKIEEYIYQLEVEKRRHENEDTVSFKMLFSLKYRKVLIMCMVLVTLQQFSGVDAVVFYADQMFRGNKHRMVNELTGRLLSIAFSVIKFCTAICASAITDRVGRRPLFSVGSIGISISLLFLAISSWKLLPWLQASMLFFYIIMYSISLGPIVWILVPETLPDRGVTIVLLTHWTTSFMIVESFPFMAEYIGQAGTFLFYMVFCIICFFIVYFYLPETAQKNREEIYKAFMNEEELKEYEKTEERELIDKLIL